MTEDVKLEFKLVHIGPGVARLTVGVPEEGTLDFEIDQSDEQWRKSLVCQLRERWPGIDEKDLGPELERIKEEMARAESEFVDPAENYVETAQGLTWMKPTKDGPVPVHLANFTARIVSSVIVDDGVEPQTSLEIRATRAGKETTFTIPSGSFSSMNWIIEELGPEALIFPGQSIKEHARVAIQVKSGRVPRRVVYRHTGWRKPDGVWCYLHAGGAIGPEGTVMEVETLLDQRLAEFELPNPPADEELRSVVRAGMDLLELGSPGITFPLLASVAAVLVTEPDFTLHLTGPSGGFKTEIAALFQSFWGQGLTARNLPGSWSSTANSLEELAFLAKNALVVIDDFAPCGSATDVRRMHRDADRIIRAQGNSSGRGRMRADGTLRAIHPPRGLILSTGEDIPAGHSLRARLLTIEVSPGDVTPEALTRAQQSAHAGRYAQMNAAFIRWLAGSLDEIRSRVIARALELRSSSRWEKAHTRTPGLVSTLLASFEILLEFATEVGALDTASSARLAGRAEEALAQLAQGQAEFVVNEEPTKVFLTLLQAAVTSGEAHVADTEGNTPTTLAPEALGWRQQGTVWSPQGRLVGWADDDGLYLNMESAFKAAQQMGTDTNRLTIGPRTLVKRLSEYGLLVSKDTERGKHTIRKVLAGSRRTVIHLAIDTLLVRAHRAHGAHEAHHADEMPGRGPEPWARNERLDTRPGPSSGPPVVPGVPVAAGRGPHGPEGPEVAGETGERSLDEGWGEL